MYYRTLVFNCIKSAFLAILIGVSGVVSAAEISSDILGTVNVSGGSSDGYVVTVKNTRTGLSREKTLGSKGDFRFASMPDGSYDITVANQGKVVGQDTVTVSVGGNAVANFDITDAGTVEEIVVVGSRVRFVDLYSTDRGLTIGEQQIDSMPVGRDLTSVALLAPGVILGSTGFSTPGGDKYASFGGSSISENSCFINGLEVTNTRQGLGCGSVPFEFYDNFQVKTGGYSAQFGRTTGGVINTTTKSGGNEWEFAFTSLFIPDSLRGQGQYSTLNNGSGLTFRDERDNKQSTTEFTISASGPIVQDKLFIYAIVNPRDTQQAFSDYPGTARISADSLYRDRNASGGDNLFWGTKLDWEINDYHSVDIFAYSDRRDEIENVYNRNSTTRVRGASTTTVNLRSRGGDASSITYTGSFFDSLTITAMYGNIEAEYETTPSNVSCFTVVDNRTSIPVSSRVSGCGPGGSFGTNFDDNAQTRLDAEYVLGDHSVRLGYDFQDRQSTRVTDDIGGHNYIYTTYAPGDVIQGTTIAPNGDLVRDRRFFGGGAFSSELTAYYLEDTWNITDNLVFNLGVRKDTYKNSGITDVVFVDLETDWAPRLGLSWDPTGEAKYKIYGTWGRYYLPVPNNTNYRAAGGISDSSTHYQFTGIDANGGPTGLTPVVTTINSVPVIPSVATFQSEEAEPFFKDETILGFETSLTDEYTLSIKGIYRTVGSALDDYCGDLAPSCVLLNPGESNTWQLDFVGGFDLNGDPAGDGIPDPGTRHTYTAEEIGLQKGKNEYLSIQPKLDFKSDNLEYSLIYAWSKSEGNFEGAVKSDINQADAGITQDFDFPALMDGADGRQSNDREHVVKFFGNYNLTRSFTMGAKITYAAGRPLSLFGRGYPSATDNTVTSTDPHIYGSYGDTYYIRNNVTGEYVLTPRGAGGTSPSTTSIDLSMSYKFEASDVKMRAYFDIFNLLDANKPTSLNEHFELTSLTDSPYYGAAYTWQEPRKVRLGFEARF